MRYSLVLALLVTLPLVLQAQPPVRADFEDLSLPPQSNYHGADNAGGFSSRGVFFSNSYIDFGGGFSIWSGFSYSNITDTTTSGFGNQFAAYHLPAGGGDASSNFGVGFASVRGDGFISLPAGYRPTNVRLTNTTYAALSMRDGDSFAKKFGGPTGLDPDFFSVTFYGVDSGGLDTGSVTFFLADYRAAGTVNDYVVSQWTTVDLSTLGENTQRIEFDFASSDFGPFGINTPTYVALDNLVLTAVPEPHLLALLGSIGAFAYCRRRRMAAAQQQCQEQINSQFRAAL